MTAKRVRPGRRIGALVALLTLSTMLTMVFALRDVIAGEPPAGQPPPNQGAPKAANPNLGKVRPLTDKDFDRAIKRGVSAVYFWAEWCGPCRSQGPIVDTLAMKYSGKVKVFKMDVDTQKEVTQKYQVGSVPTIILFHAGKGVVKLIGVTDEDELTEEIEEILTGITAGAKS